MKNSDIKALRQIQRTTRRKLNLVQVQANHAISALDIVINNLHKVSNAIAGIDNMILNSADTVSTGYGLHTKIQARISANINELLVFNYEAYPNRNEPVDNLSVKAIENGQEVRFEFTSLTTSSSYISEIYYDPCWIHVAEAAQRAILETEETEYINLVGITKISDNLYRLEMRTDSNED